MAQLELLTGPPVVPYLRFEGLACASTEPASCLVSLLVALLRRSAEAAVAVFAELCLGLRLPTLSPPIKISRSNTEL